MIDTGFIEYCFRLAPDVVRSRFEVAFIVPADDTPMLQRLLSLHA